MQSDYDTAQAIASEPIYDTIVEEGQEYIELSPLNTATVSTIWTIKGFSDLEIYMIFFFLSFYVICCENLKFFLPVKPNSLVIRTEMAA